MYLVKWGIYERKSQIKFRNVKGCCNDHDSCISYFFHCINVQLTDVNLIGKLGNSYYCNPRFSWKLSMLALIAPMGQIGNAIFFLLSGYFMINNTSINLIKTSKKLLDSYSFL